MTTPIERLKLMLIKPQYATDISEDGICTITYKVLNGKMYILKSEYVAGDETPAESEN
jgi:hypothetical protein